MKPYFQIFKLSHFQIILRLCVFAFILSSCSHWNWVLKNKQEVREQICTPDTVAETIIKERLVPVIEIDTSMLQILNEYEANLLAMDDSIQRLNSFKVDTTILRLKYNLFKMQGVIANLRELATNTKIREIEKRVPYPVYIDKQSTITKLNTEIILNRRLWIAIGALSFILLILVGIIVYILKR